MIRARSAERKAKWKKANSPARSTDYGKGVLDTRIERKESIKSDKSFSVERHACGDVDVSDPHGQWL